MIRDALFLQCFCFVVWSYVRGSLTRNPAGRANHVDLPVSQHDDDRRGYRLGRRFAARRRTRICRSSARISQNGK